MDDFVGRKNLIPPERLRELSARSDLRAALQTASHFGAIGLTGVALYFTWGSALAIPVFVLHGMLLNFLFAAQHEYNHYTVFSSRALNDFFNRITGFLVLYPRTYERWFHFAHHRNTQSWDHDPELTSRGGPYRLRGYLLYLVGITYWLSRFRTFYRHAKGGVREDYLTEAQAASVTREARWHLAGYAAVAVVSAWFESYVALQLWLAPLLGMKVLHQLQNITEHTGLTHEPDTVHNTRTIRTWRVLRWMAWNMQYHTAHHTYPAVPFHRLPELHAEMVARLGYEPPTLGYLEFQRRFIRRLMAGPESLAGIGEVGVARGVANAATSV